MENFLTHQGYLALVVFAVIEAACIPIPSEITFGFAGVLAGTGRLSLAGVIVIGTAGEVAGSFIAYGVGRAGGRALVDHLGRYVLLTTSDIDRAERWFAGRGELAVAIGRAMPVLRAFVSVVAGFGEMSLARFTIASTVGTLAFAAALSSIGYAVGQSWHRIAHDFSLAGYLIAALVVLTIAIGILHRLKTLRIERTKVTDVDQAS